jgi:hypothetical protein
MDTASLVAVDACVAVITDGGAGEIMVRGCVESVKTGMYPVNGPVVGMVQLGVVCSVIAFGLSYEIS